MAFVPNEILYIICTLLRHQRDLNTLFNCACSGGRLVESALKNLYRVHEVAVVVDGGSNRTIDNAQNYGKEFTGRWRTIILSSLGMTLYPYSEYIRRLDLGELENMLKFSDGEGYIDRKFFHDDLAELVLKPSDPCSICASPYVAETVARIGETVTMHTPLLEELSADVNSRVLSRWIPRLPRLTVLKLRHAGALEGNEALIRSFCPSLKALHVYDWHYGGDDQVLAAFFNQLRPQTLESFEAADNNDVGSQTLQALSCHGDSLIELTLKRIKPENVPKISLLSSCTILVSLSLGAVGPFFDDVPAYIDLKGEHNEAFLDMVAWLKKCKHLRHLAITNFSHDDAALMTSILLDTSNQLTSFEYEGIGFSDTEEFLPALANLTSLESLYLVERSGTAEWNMKATDVLVDSLTKLVNLKTLDVGRMANNFRTSHIVQIARSLPKLEVWFTSGELLDDGIWESVASLRSLRRLEFSGETIFTNHGIIDFIEKLRPCNECLFLTMASRMTEECTKLLHTRFTRAGSVFKNPRIEETRYPDHHFLMDSDDEDFFQFSGKGPPPYIPSGPFGWDENDWEDKTHPGWW